MVVKDRLYYTKMSPLIKLNDVKGAPAGTTTHTRPFMSSRDHGQRNKGRHLCLVSGHPMFPLASLWVKVDGCVCLLSCICSTTNLLKEGSEVNMHIQKAVLKDISVMASDFKHTSGLRGLLH